MLLGHARAQRGLEAREDAVDLLGRRVVDAALQRRVGGVGDRAAGVAQLG